ncbi:hypothetical protein HY358_01530 [Candidatus Roizmanbacteria bacterium]|nr:hypothetical protein [Candidatus Roizmanbacteria bacterium]
MVIIALFVFLISYSVFSSFQMTKHSNKSIYQETTQDGSLNHPPLYGIQPGVGGGP